MACDISRDLPSLPTHPLLLSSPPLALSISLPLLPPSPFEKYLPLCQYLFQLRVHPFVRTTIFLNIGLPPLQIISKAHIKVLKCTCTG